MSDELHKVVFLDRDGTINVDHGYVYKQEDWEWTPQAREALKKLQDAGFSLAVITNQSGIGHGMYSEEQMQTLHTFMKKELADIGVDIVIAYCPHARTEGCDCRKPNTGMLKVIEAELGAIDYAASWTVGDKGADMGFGKKAGTKTILIESKYWSKEALVEQPDYIVRSLAEAADLITK